MVTNLLHFIYTFCLFLLWDWDIQVISSGSVVWCTSHKTKMTGNSRDGSVFSHVVTRSTAIVQQKIFHSARRRFLVPLVVGFTVGFLLRLNHMLLINKHEWTDDDDATLELKTRIKNNSSYFSNNLQPNTRNVTDKVILCWVLSESAALNKVIRETWGRRCDHLLFMVTKQKHYAADEVKLPTSEQLFLKPTHWQKTREAWCYVYEHYFDKADWFLATQHDSYVVVENLRLFLKVHEYQTDSSIYLGHAFRNDDFNYISTNPAYLFSKDALQRFGNAYSRNLFSFKDWISFHSSFDSDSYTLGVYMNKIKVTAIDARDLSSRLLFVPDILDRIIFKTSSFKDLLLKDTDLYSVDKGLDCCSDVAIALNIFKPMTDLPKFEYALYHLKAYGFNLSGFLQY